MGKPHACLFTGCNKPFEWNWNTVKANGDAVKKGYCTEHKEILVRDAYMGATEKQFELYMAVTQ